MARIDDFQNAINLAREKLPYYDPEEMCRNAGAELLAPNGAKNIVFPFFVKKVNIAYPEGTVVYDEGADSIPPQEQGLILHYLLGVNHLPLTGELITFREIPSGEFYYQPFLTRAQVPLVNTFGYDHELFLKAGKKLGGKEMEVGDASMTFHPFPKIPITLILWKGDEEFSPVGNILYDSSIKNFLHVEDIAFLTGTTVYKLMAISKS
ncbi:MAG: DUF3786 domain-containing protein [Syntrophales bacterium]|nr:DUF3786 domain-containing protein [Syntrophales bacterium]